MKKIKEFWKKLKYWQKAVLVFFMGYLIFPVSFHIFGIIKNSYSQGQFYCLYLGPQYGYPCSFFEALSDWTIKSIVIYNLMLFHIAIFTGLIALVIWTLIGFIIRKLKKK